MSYESPTPPASLPTDLVNALNESAPKRLRHVARYAEELAEYKEREARLEEESDQDEMEQRPDDLPDDVPTKATITIKYDGTFYTPKPEVMEVKIGQHYLVDREVVVTPVTKSNLVEKQGPIDEIADADFMPSH